ncbi:ribosome biogenesis protein BOP1 homolog [Vigna umbellata]|uniref:ribosome biogenesis protein BOP1 homolog n=1 Tax=Vigna umbellata TaxID=87088 RepID=UPI001F5F34F9|nr:ribosome biogenesis protein BOP1 homolog [Vigna umbellata]
MEEGHCEGEVEGEAEFGKEMKQGESEVAKQIEHVEDEEDENEDDHVDEAEDEAGDDGQDEDVDESVSEESLVDVTIECDIGTSKGNVREEQPFSPVGESSRTTDNESMHDVHGLSNIEWVSNEFDNGPNSDEDDDSICRTLFPTFSMPKSLTDYKWEVRTYFTEKKEFTDAIRTYALSNGRNLKFMNNNKKRVAVKCLGVRGNANGMLIVPIGMV